MILTPTTSRHRPDLSTKFPIGEATVIVEPFFGTAEAVAADIHQARSFVFCFEAPTFPKKIILFADPLTNTDQRFTHRGLALSWSTGAYNALLNAR